MTSALDGWSRADLCTIGRELMLAAHLQDRTSVPAVLAHVTMEEALQLSIDEWMMVSPLYTRRMQRLLAFEGTDVPTIFKGLQLDVGFAHQFMDVGYDLRDAKHGQFWLRTCGALADVVPMGPEMVRGMCHDIEDPTFDATAVATNARAQVRPVHRPPEVPRGGPDCHWTVVIDDDADPVGPHPWLEQMAASVCVQLPNEPDVPADDGAGGWADYSGPFDPDFELERLSTRALHVVLREFAVQGHLLARAMMCAVSQRHGHELAVAVGEAIFTGIGWVAAERLTAALRIDRTDPAAVATVLPLTHFLLPADYVGLHVEAGGDGTSTIRLSPDAAGLGEGDPYSLPGLLADGAEGIVEAMVHGVDPTLVVTASGSGSSRAWSVGPGTADAATEPSPVQVARFSTGVAIDLRRRVPNPDVGAGALPVG